MRFAIFLLCAPFALPQSGLGVVKAYYQQSLSGAQEASTKDDLKALVEKFDSPLRNPEPGLAFGEHLT